MKRFLHSIRWLLAFLVIIPTFILIVGGSLVVSVSETVTNSDTPKQWLQDGDVYENAITVGVNEILRKAQNETGETMTVEEMTRGIADKERVQSIANTVFPPTWVKTQAENIIDSIYAFLNGDTETISFTIDLTQVNDVAKQELSALFVDIAESLPPCSSESSISIEELDLFEADCLPQNITLSDIKTTIENEVDTIPYFQRNEIRSEELNLQLDNVESIRYVFEGLESAPLLLLFATLLLTFVIFLLVPVLRNKLKTIGYLWSLGGLTVIVIAFLAKISFSSFILDFILTQIPHEGSELISLLSSPVKIAYADITGYMLMLGAFIFAIGGIVAILSLFVKQK